MFGTPQKDRRQEQRGRRRYGSCERARAHTTHTHKPAGSPGGEGGFLKCLRRHSRAQNLLRSSNPFGWTWVDSEHADLERSSLGYLVLGQWAAKGTRPGDEEEVLDALMNKSKASVYRSPLFPVSSPQSLFVP